MGIRAHPTTGTSGSRGMQITTCWTSKKSIFSSQLDHVLDITQQFAFQKIPKGISVSEGMAFGITEMQHTALHHTALCVLLSPKCTTVSVSYFPTPRSNPLELCTEINLRKANESKQHCWVSQICKQKASEWSVPAGTAWKGGLDCQKPRESSSTHTRQSRCQSGHQMDSCCKASRNKLQLCSSKKHQIHSNWT